MHFRKTMRILAFGLVITMAAAGVPAYASQPEADIFTFEQTSEEAADSAGEETDSTAGEGEGGTSSDGQTQTGTQDASDGTDSTDSSSTDSTGSAQTDTDSAADAANGSTDGTDGTQGSDAAESDKSDESASDSSSSLKKSKKSKKNKLTAEEKAAAKAEKKKKRLNKKWRASVKPYTVSASAVVNQSYDTYHLIGDSQVGCYTACWNGYNAVTSHYTYTKTKNADETTDTADILTVHTDTFAAYLTAGTSNSRRALYEVLYTFGYANKTAQAAGFGLDAASDAEDGTDADDSLAACVSRTVLNGVSGSGLADLTQTVSANTLLVEAAASSFTAACAEEEDDNTQTTSAVVFCYGQDDAASGNYAAAVDYVQEAEEAAALDEANDYFIVSVLPTGDKETDKKIRRYNRVLRNTAAENAHVHYIDVYEYAKKQEIYNDGTLTEKESRRLYNRIRKMTARFNTEQAEEITTYAKQWDIPSGLGRVYTYMGWSKVTSRSSAQYRLRLSYGEDYDENGFAKIQADTSRYVIACTSYFGKVGDLIDFTLSNGEVIHTIVGDIKNQNDEGCTILGHQYGQSIVEFVVNTAYWYGTDRTVTGFHPEWAGCSVTTVTNYGNIREQ